MRVVKRIEKVYLPIQPPYQALLTLLRVTYYTLHPSIHPIIHPNKTGTAFAVPESFVQSMGSLALATSDVLVTTVHFHTTSFHLPQVYHDFLVV